MADNKVIGFYQPVGRYGLDGVAVHLIPVGQVGFEGMYFLNVLAEWSKKFNPMGHKLRHQATDAVMGQALQWLSDNGWVKSEKYPDHEVWVPTRKCIDCGDFLMGDDQSWHTTYVCKKVGAA